MSKIISISDPITERLDNVRTLHDCSYSEAIIHLVKGDDTVRNIVLDRMNDMDIHVRRMYPYSDARCEEVLTALSTLKHSVAVLLKAMNTFEERRYDDELE